MDGATLAKAMGNSLTQTRYNALAPAFDDALRQANCNTVKRAAMFCAQVGHESAGLRYMEEIASGAAYEGRVDLGNTQKGDGKRFKGRGPIQVTGRYNYRQLSQWAHAKGYVPNAEYFIRNPGKLASDKYGFLGAVWYWTVARNMNSYADRADIRGATRAINGGLNGLSDRTRRWDRCRKIGKPLLPPKGGTVAATKKRSIRKGDLVRVTTRSGLNARKTPRGAHVKRGGRNLVRPYDFRIRVARSIWYKADGGQRWIQGTGGIWYCARLNGKSFVKRVIPGKKKKTKIKTPVPGYGISTPWRKRPNNRTYWQSRGYHTGVDYAAPTGAKIVAVRPGKVVHYWDRTLGKIVLLYANNNKTYWYCHMNTRTKNGKQVKAGQKIGTVGASGTGANGPHLHLEKRRGHSTKWSGPDRDPTKW